MKYSVGDTVVAVDVNTRWSTNVTVQHEQLFGINVTDIKGPGAANCFISIDDDMKYVDICAFNDGCKLQYVGQAILPWYAR